MGRCGAARDVKDGTTPATTPATTPVNAAADDALHRALTIGEMVRAVAELGFGWIELSPREDFMPFFPHPRADDARVAEPKNALRTHGVRLSSVLPLYTWSSPDETERQAAVRYWKRTIEITVRLERPLMNWEFKGRAEQAAASEAAFWRTLEELLPVCEREGIALNLEAHPGRFLRGEHPGRLPRPRAQQAVGEPPVLRPAPLPPLGRRPGGGRRGDDALRGDRLQHVHIADIFDHRAPAGCATSSARRAPRRRRSCWTGSARSRPRSAVRGARAGVRGR